MSDINSVTLAPDEDPIKVLRAMAKFLPGEDRGLAEIKDENTTLGYVALVGAPEKVMLPTFDAKTRAAEVVDLATWLKARGYEATACRWTNLGGAPRVRNPEIKWTLATGPAQVPKLPPAWASTQPMTAAQGAAHLAAKRSVSPPSRDMQSAWKRILNAGS